MDEVLRDVLEPVHHPRLVFLSGPSFAKEVAARKATAVTLACHDETYAISVQESLSCPWFRCYSHDDVLGVEIGGALKNVVAIAVGICDGLGLGLNARAGLIDARAAGDLAPRRRPRARIPSRSSVWRAWAT